MDEQFRRFESIFAEEDFQRKYGINRWRMKDDSVITAVSQPTWSNYLGSMDALDERDQIIVSPELITLSDLPFSDVLELREIIENRVNQIIDVSKDYPQKTFLLGTPTYLDGHKPQNSVLFIQNGSIVGQTHKRSGATIEERQTFTLNPEEPAAVVPDTDLGVLICADLATATLYDRDIQNRDEVLALIGRETFIGLHPTFVHSRARKIVVLSCWGVGGNRYLMGENNSDQYYYDQLRSIASGVLRNRDELTQILVVDRVPKIGDEEQAYTPSRPFNVLFSARQWWRKN